MRIFWPLGALLYCCVSIAVNGQVASKDSRIIGMWRLISVRQTRADGTVQPDAVLGSKPVGYIVYSEAGVMCAFLSNPDRPRWKVQSAPDESELRSAINGLVAYCGTYEVNEKERYVIHHVQMDKVPNIAGTDRKRFFTLSDDRLVLRPAELPEGIKDWTIEWERIAKK